MGIHFREQHDFVRILEITPKERKRIEATIQMLVDLLDRLDPDPEMEDSGDNEPYLGWADITARYSLSGMGDDREAEEEHDEDGGDFEPTLGAPDRHPRSIEFAPFGVVIREPGPISRGHDKSQEHWADGLPGDHEREFDDDCEPDYGWSAPRW